MLLRSAWHSTGQPDAVEAHGSGTPLGDPIEVQSMLRALRPQDERRLFIGSLKAHVVRSLTALACLACADGLPRMC